MRSIERLSDTSWWLGVVPILLVLGLLPISLHSQLLFHTLVELFAVLIAITCFVVAWNTYAFSRNHHLMFLGIGYLWVGVIDLGHTLTFPGMPFSGANNNTTVQLWVVARSTEALLMLLAPLVIGLRFHRGLMFGLFALVNGLALIALMSGQLPAMIRPGGGLTLTKVYSEYLIIGVLLAAALLLWRRRFSMDSRTYGLILVSIGLTVCAEVTFTLYTNLHGVTFTVGHVLKLFSFWVIYIALVESSLKEPFRTLSREATTYDAVPDETVLVDSEGIVRQVNNAVRHVTGRGTDDCVGVHCHELLHPLDIAVDDCLVCQSILLKQPLDGVEFYDKANEQWYEATLSNIHYSGESAGMVHVRRNITIAKLSHERFVSLNRLYTVLSHTNKAIVHARSREAMFQAICDITIAKGGFKMAWIGIINGPVVKPLRYAGDEGGYLQEMQMRVDDSDLAQGPVGRAAKTCQVSYVNDTASDPDFKPWREAARQRGYGALAAVPLQYNSDVIGIFTLYSEQPHVFDDKMTELLASMGDDISAALFHIDQEQRRREAEAKLRQLSQAVEQSANAIIITNIHSRIEYVNRAFTLLTGYHPDEVLGKKPSILRSDHTPDSVNNEIIDTLTAGKEWYGELLNRKKDGSHYWALQSISAIRDEVGNITHFVSTSEDNTELHEAQETIKQLAFYDPLTNLPNRRLLSDRLEQAIERVQRYPEQVLAVMVFDLDNFKTVNDSLGHDYGDMLLKRVAEIFKSLVRKEDTVARLGGDEFTIVLNGMKSIDRVTDLADLIIQTLKPPIDLSGSQVVIGTSIGIAIYPQDARDTDTLLRNADMAMYHAKAEGKNNFQFYQEEMNQKARERLVLENNLRGAIENDHFVLFYQPQVNLNTGELIGVEALIRWIDPDKGMIPPDFFIALAEETGMIGKIGDWVIRKACEEIRYLHQAGFAQVKVAVNVSAYQFRHGDHLCEVIEQALADTCLSPEYLSLELTESILIENINDTIDVLNELKKLNITLAVDDFGTGYSSLSYLKQFPIDVLKVDKSFIRDILTDPSDEAIVTAIIAMAHKLGLEVLAEGVETIEHNHFLIDQGCDYGQGYLYCKPMPADQLLKTYKIDQGPAAVV